MLVPAIAIMLALCSLPARAAEDCVIIVSAANPADSISSGDLKKMYLGEKTAWANGAKVSTATPGPDSPDYGVAIKKATGMSAGDFKRYMLQMSFVGKIVPLPRPFDTPAAMVHFVGGTPGGVGCVPAAAAATGVKVLKVE